MTRPVNSAWKNGGAVAKSKLLKERWTWRQRRTRELAERAMKICFPGVLIYFPRLLGKRLEILILLLPRTHTSKWQCGAQASSSSPGRVWSSTTSSNCSVPSIPAMPRDPLSKGTLHHSCGCGVDNRGQQIMLATFVRTTRYSDSTWAVANITNNNSYLLNHGDLQ